MSDNKVNDKIDLEQLEKWSKDSGQWIVLAPILKPLIEALKEAQELASDALLAAHILETKYNEYKGELLRSKVRAFLSRFTEKL